MFGIPKISQSESKSVLNNIFISSAFFIFILNQHYNCIENKILLALEIMDHIVWYRPKSIVNGRGIYRIDKFIIKMMRNMAVMVIGDATDGY